MRRLLLAAVLLAAAAMPAERGGFIALDVYIDAGDRGLAAYQFELVCDAKIVGLEGGDGLFAPPPYHDPAALQGGRIVVAAFTADDAPPTGRVRVARLHLYEEGEVTYAPRLTVAVAPGGERFDAEITVVRLGGNR